jgi:signal transduction histidine kinase
MAPELSVVVSLASAGVALLSAGVTLYLGRKAQHLQIALKILERRLKQADERRSRGMRLVESVQRMRLSLYGLRSSIHVKSVGSTSTDDLLAAFQRVEESDEDLKNAWATFHIDFREQGIDKIDNVLQHRSAFLSGATHELRQPLNMLRPYVQRLQVGQGSIEENESMKEALLNSIEKFLPILAELENGALRSIEAGELLVND